MPKPGGIIYAIGAVGTAFVKIGSTRISVERRLRSLQTGQPFPLQSVYAERLATLARLLGVSADYLLGLHDDAHVAPRATQTHDAAQEQTPPTQRPRRRTAAAVG